MSRKYSETEQEELEERYLSERMAPRYISSKPDKYILDHWFYKDTGIMCVVTATDQSNVLNGYLRLPDNEYAFTPGVYSTEDCINGRNTNDLHVHGGLTYVDTSSHWIGFDTNHGTEQPGEWTVKRMHEECEQLARQLADTVAEAGGRQ